MSRDLEDLADSHEELARKLRAVHEIIGGDQELIALLLTTLGGAKRGVARPPRAHITARAEAIAAFFHARNNVPAPVKEIAAATGIPLNTVYNTLMHTNAGSAFAKVFRANTRYCVWKLKETQP
jgi:hypothetical protein